MRSANVTRILGAKKPPTAISKKAVRIAIPAAMEELKRVDPAQAKAIQAHIRVEFADWFAKGYSATAIVQGESGMDYILEPGIAK